ncbi:MAG: hypothetical protein ACOC5L_01550 [Halobacteriota archaeon]
MTNGDYRYYKIALSNIIAIIGIDGGEGVKTVECSNYKTCSHSNVLEGDKCPRYCMVIVEAKHYDYGRKETRAEIQELSESEVMGEARKVFA